MYHVALRVDINECFKVIRNEFPQLVAYCIAALVLHIAHVTVIALYEAFGSDAEVFFCKGVVPCNETVAVAGGSVACSNLSSFESGSNGGKTFSYGL